MAFYSIEDKKLTEIANAIRNKTGRSGSITVEEMPEQILEITSNEGDSLPDGDEVSY